jgi:hypothetical protein
MPPQNTVSRLARKNLDDEKGKSPWQEADDPHPRSSHPA